MPQAVLNISMSVSFSYYTILRIDFKQMPGFDPYRQAKPEKKDRPPVSAACIKKFHSLSMRGLAGLGLTGCSGGIGCGIRGRLRNIRRNNRWISQNRDFHTPVLGASLFIIIVRDR